MNKQSVLITLLIVSLILEAPVVSAQAVRVNGFDVTFDGRTYDGANDQTIFAYTVAGTGAPPDLSHFDIALPFCVPTLTLVAFSPSEAVSFGVDPTTGISGIKWDLPLKVDETRTYTLAFQGYVGEGVVEVAVKGGPGFEIGSLPGPTCLAASVDVEKHVSVDGGATWDDADAAPGPEVEPGSAVAFKVVVTNDGDLPLVAIALADSAIDLTGCTVPDTLDPGASFGCAAGPVEAAEGQHTNTATVTAVYETATVTDADDANYFGGVLEPPEPPPPVPVGGACPLSQGYWKNHPNHWPVASLTLGSQPYTQAELLTLLHTPATGDASIILAHQLIAAKLNLANGADPAPIADTTAGADALLSGFEGKLPYGVAPSSLTGQGMVSAAETLDQYNNGQLTPDCGVTLPVVIEGPVTVINGNIIVINDIDIWLAPNDPLLTIIQVGDELRCEGYYETRDTIIVLIAITVVYVDVDVYVAADTDVDLTIYYTDEGDWDCKNPPPPWAPANGWRRKCGGMVPEPGSRGKK